MRWSNQGTMLPATIEEAAALNHSIAAICTCANMTSFNAHGLWWRFMQKQWDQRLTEARLRFYCRPCWHLKCMKVRAARLVVVGRTSFDVQLPWPPEREWKQAMRRVR